MSTATPAASTSDRIRAIIALTLLTAELVYAFSTPYLPHHPWIHAIVLPIRFELLTLIAVQAAIIIFFRQPSSRPDATLWCSSIAMLALLAAATDPFRNPNLTTHTNLVAGLSTLPTLITLPRPIWLPKPESTEGMR